MASMASVAGNSNAAGSVINLDALNAAQVELDSELQCCVCLDSFTAEGATAPFSLSNCAHKLHEYCAPPKTASGNIKCPLCREESPKLIKDTTLAKVIGAAKKALNAPTAGNAPSSAAPAKVVKDKGDSKEPQVGKLKALAGPAADPNESVRLAIGAAVGLLLDPPIVTRENIAAKKSIPSVDLTDEGLIIKFYAGQKAYAQSLEKALIADGYRGVQFSNGTPEMGEALRGGQIVISNPREYLEFIAKHCKIDEEAHINAFLEKRADSLNDQTKGKIMAAIVQLNNKGIIKE